MKDSKYVYSWWQTTFSNILLNVGRINIGLWLFTSFLSLDLKTGTTRAILKEVGKWPEDIEIFIKRVNAGEIIADMDFNIVVENLFIFEDLFLNDIIILLTWQFNRS